MASGQTTSWRHTDERVGLQSGLDAQLFEWTAGAINQGYRGQVREEFQILTFAQDHLITGPGGSRFGQFRVLDQSAPLCNGSIEFLNRPLPDDSGSGPPFRL